MPDIFGTNLSFGGAFRAQRGIIQDPRNLAGILMQNLQVQYGRPVQRIYELGNSGADINTYYIEGRPNGTLTTSHIIGPSNNVITFMKTYGDICKAGENTMTLTLKPGENICIGTGVANTPGAVLDANNIGISIRMTHCVLMSIGFSVAADNLIITETSQLMFNALEINDIAGAPPPRPA